MTYERFVKKYVLSPNRKAIGKSLARNAEQAFAKHSIEYISHKYSSNMTQKSKVVCSHTYVVPNSTFFIVSLLM